MICIKFTFYVHRTEHDDLRRRTQAGPQRLHDRQERVRVLLVEPPAQVRYIFFAYTEHTKDTTCAAAVVLVVCLLAEIFCAQASRQMRCVVSRAKLKHIYSNYYRNWFAQENARTQFERPPAAKVRRSSVCVDARRSQRRALFKCYHRRCCRHRQAHACQRFYVCACVCV